MATIAPHVRKQLDQLDLDIESTQQEISQQDGRIIIAVQKSEDTTNAENEAVVLWIILEAMKSMRGRILQGISGVEPQECGAQGKTPFAADCRMPSRRRRKSLLWIAPQPIY